MFKTTYAVKRRGCEKSSRVLRFCVDSQTLEWFVSLWVFLTFHGGSDVLWRFSPLAVPHSVIAVPGSHPEKLDAAQGADAGCVDVFG